MLCHSLIILTETVLTLRLAMTNAGVIWIDNFSKTLARSVPTMKAGAWTGMLWTGVGVKPCHDDCQVDMSIRQTPAGDVPAMPTDMFHDLTAYIAWVTSQFTENGLHDESLCHTFGVKRVPPKIKTTKLPGRRVRVRLTKSTDGLHRLVPLNILQHNIGSNEGLMKVVRAMMDIHAEDPSYFFIINADINIYDRLLKVITI